MQYGYQVHQVEVPVKTGDLTGEDMRQTVEEFETLYERLYGKGAGKGNKVNIYPTPPEPLRVGLERACSSRQAHILA